MTNTFFSPAGISCGRNHTVFLKNDGTVWGCGSNASGELGLGDTTISDIIRIHISDVSTVACGHRYTIFLKKDGTVWGCGRNDFNQLGLVDDDYDTGIVKSNISDVYKGGFI